MFNVFDTSERDPPYATRADPPVIIIIIIIIIRIIFCSLLTDVPDATVYIIKLSLQETRLSRCSMIGRYHTTALYSLGFCYH